ncbi:hypothetical protein DFH08DRAFT_968504 [Mycena albidolilacea]|uniref:DUF6699 domain-containing protein n=1 Tax=Mycena albidolilacea TaxID=1033008 RepID=A0AAD6ZJX9_9AGAR|nr:hypothetical protein DFH08DRAFT_968504 [Mycena albidolilacea]
MSRHVHFASANSFQPPPPLGRSFPSSASSSGPLTPPQLAHAGPLGPAFMPGEFYVESPVAYSQAHSLIAFSTRPSLRYDVSLHPSMITTLSSGVSSAGLLEPAVYPPQAEITLATPHLPWQISVPASNKRFVTVADVLNTIYHTLRVNATSAEFEALRTDKLMRQVSAEYTKRCKRLRGYHGHKQEKREGIKRVDFLMGYHQFQGIAPKDGVPGVWHLTIS